MDEGYVKMSMSEAGNACYIGDFAFCHAVFRTPYEGPWFVWARDEARSRTGVISARGIFRIRCVYIFYDASLPSRIMIFSYSFEGRPFCVFFLHSV